MVAALFWEVVWTANSQAQNCAGPLTKITQNSMWRVANEALIVSYNISNYCKRILFTPSANELLSIKNEYLWTSLTKWLFFFVTIAHLTFQKADDVEDG